MKKLLLALGILALICSPALAGKNAGGAFVAHTNDGVTYTSQNPPYCQDQYNPADCESVITQTNKDENTPAVIWFMAAFPEGSQPAVTGAQFGVYHNLPPGQGYVANWSACGPNPLVLPDQGFPDVPGGTLIGYGSPIMDRFFTLAWFAAYGNGPGTYFRSGVYPGDGTAAVTDDSVPPVLDIITRFGEVRWFEQGFEECPEAVTPGACCYPDGSCEVVEATQCTGVYQGDGTTCEEVECPAPEACCFEDGSCADLLAEDCIGQGGTPQGADTDCATVECPTPPAACCFEDGSCDVLEETACLDAGGEFHPEWPTCDVAECEIPPQPGACCIDEVCSVILETECADLGGLWMNSPTCEGIVCPPVATESSTWGQIKANYR
jgi:hypothetical protein